MKILLPYKKFSEVSIFDDKIPGGLEKFAKLVYQNIPNVIPIEFTFDDQRKRRVTAKMAYEAKKHNVDVILSNYDNTPLMTRLQDQVNLPVFLIGHTLALTAFKLKVMKEVPKFLAKGGTIALVSGYQFDTWKKMSGKVNPEFEFEISGFVCPSFCSGTEKKSYEKRNNIIVVGRGDKAKNPFFVINKLEEYKKKYGHQPFDVTVITTKYRLEKNAEYLRSNSHWDSDPQYRVFWSIPHDQVLDEISKSSVLVSTCPDESFGITAMEGLSHGVPVIVITNSDDKHASFDIAATMNHLSPLRKTCKPEAFVEAVQDLMKKPASFTDEVYEMTQAKHSKDEWRKNILNLCEIAITRYEKHLQEREPDLSTFL